MKKKYIKVSDLAYLMGLKPDQIRNYLTAGKIEYDKRSKAGHRYFDLERSIDYVKDPFLIEEIRECLSCTTCERYRGHCRIAVSRPFGDGDMMTEQEAKDYEAMIMKAKK